MPAKAIQTIGVSTLVTTGTSVAVVGTSVAVVGVQAAACGGKLLINTDICREMKIKHYVF